MTVTAADAPLDIEALRKARAAARIGHRIEYFDTIGSTSDRVRELAATGAAEGVVVIAEAQTRGRGRLGRRWESPPHRNLYLSVLLRPPIEPGNTPLIALVAGLATAEAVARWVPQAQIKWPNDVLIDGRKTAGILTELHADGDALAVIVGIGVNLNLEIDELPAELQDKATSVSAATGQPIDRADFAATLLSQLQERYDQFRDAGFAALRRAWDDRSCLNGRRVTISGAGPARSGTVLGLSDDGTLRLISDEGSEMRVVAGDVTVLDGYGSNPP
jgi:BirA family biotin operon repressor/biotin-[acetyl-CoA-carboxylase] ligase